MAVKKETTFGALLALFFIFFIIMVIFYDYIQTPQPRIAPVLNFFFMGMFVFLFTFGDYLGIVGFKKKNFITDGGLIGTYKHHVVHDSDMITVYFTAYTRYAISSGFEDFSEKNVIERIKSMLTPTRTMYITDKSGMFEFVDGMNCDAPEGAVKYHGSMKINLKGLIQSSPVEKWKAKYYDLSKSLPELSTIAETAKALSEQMALSNNKDMVALSIQLGSINDNLNKTLVAMQQNQQQQNRGF